MLPPIHPKLPSNFTADSLASLVPVARSSVVDAVADRLQAEILAERLPAGSRLPSERELSLALGVNRLTLRAALARLEALGLVSTRHGAGTLVASWRERAGLDTLAVLVGSLSPGEPAWRELVASILEVRRVLAAEAVALATLRHTPDDLEVLAALASAQRTRLHDAISFARGDIAFQRAMVRAAHNVGLELVLNTFARFPDDQPELVARLYDRRDASLLFYDATLELLRAGDPDGARNVLRSTLEAIDKAWLERHAPAVIEGGKASSPSTPVTPRRSTGKGSKKK